MASTPTKPGKRKPLSSHPLFPAFVALWFGALLGLGSLAIRPTLIEGLVTTAGLDRLIPAAAPPLGTTARALIALGMAALGMTLGAVLGVLLRRRVAVTAGAATCRPLSAHEELGETLDSLGTAPTRRRPLTPAREEIPFEPAELAPLPSAKPLSFASVPPLAEPEAVDPTRPPAPAPALAPAIPEPLDLAVFAERELAAAAPADTAEPDLVALARRLQESMAHRRARQAADSAPASATLEPQQPASLPRPSRSRVSRW